VRRLALAATILPIVAAIGCKGAADDTEPAVVPKAVAFAGKVEPRFAGMWKATAGDDTLDLGKDGALAIESVTNSVAGKSKNRVKGSWLASGEGLVFRYADASGGETTLKYGAKLAGDTLVLQQSGGRLKTTYRRK